MSKMLKDLINSLVTFVLVIGTVTSTSIINSTIESWSPSMTHHSAKREKVTRKLQGSTRDFVPLSCNMNLNTTYCESWLSVYGNSSEYIDRVYIPCGRCILMDTTVPIITFRQGIDILGKLVFPESYQVVVQTPLVVVQGELELVSASKPVNGISDITFVMTGEANQTFLPVDSNSDACGLGNPCAVGKKAFVVAGGRIQAFGLNSTTPTWVKLFDVGNVSPMDDSTSELVLPNSILGMWDIGAEILITSHTMNWMNQHVRRIVEMRPSSTTGFVSVQLDKSILRPTTELQGGPAFAVEVALLSRNIVFKSGYDRTPNQGGHLMIFHTPEISQRIEGIEFVNFGQQGTLGRYPIHFHFCKNVRGSIVSKNTVRQSNNRCVVIHGSDQVLIDSNVAYDTRGHCYVTEDGIETGNQFIGNLGALTRKQDATKIAISTDSDISPSTFWITNPRNSWIANVAAGSEGSGYWIEPMKRGLRASMYPFLNPVNDPLYLFLDNVAHSNTDYGFRTYPKGYMPLKGQGVINGLKSYRNFGGAFIHGSTNLTISDSLFADNAFCNINIDKDADATDVERTTIIGFTDSYRDFTMKQKDVPSICLRPEHKVVYGIEMHTFKRRTTENGVSIQNVTVTGFDNSPCDISAPFHQSNRGDIGNRKFDMYATLRGVSVVGGSILTDLCEVSREGVDDVYVNMLGTSLPLSVTGANQWDPSNPKALLSNSPVMLSFIDPIQCVNEISHCYSICDNSCFTSVVFAIERWNTFDNKLKVCQKENPSKCIVVSEAVRPYTASDISPREYLANLPSGEYTAAILNGKMEVTWPQFVSVIPEKSECPGTYPSTNVVLDVPPITDDTICNELIRNGNMEQLLETNSTIPTIWSQRKNVNILAIARAGLSRSTAVQVRKLSATGRKVLEQSIDTRCVKANEGRWYRISAYIKETNARGVNFYCKTKETCPEIGLQTRSGYKIAVAQSLSRIVVNGYRLQTGLIQIDSTLASADMVSMYIRSESAPLMTIDNVSMTLVKIK